MATNKAAQEQETRPEAEVSEKPVEERPEEEVAVEEKPGEEKPEERDELEALRQELEKVKAQAEEYLDGWRRTQAEFANFRKRQEAERERLTALANANLLRKLLPVVDDFERAAMTLPDGLRSLTWCEGVFLIQHKLNAILESEGVKPIETEGKTFDPRYHEAVTYEEVEGYEDGQIIGEVQRGYVLGEWVLRPALVRVAKVPPPAQAEEKPEEEKKEE